MLFSFPCAQTSTIAERGGTLATQTPSIWTVPVQTPGDDDRIALMRKSSPVLLSCKADRMKGAVQKVSQSNSRTL